MTAQIPSTFSATITREVSLPYLLYLPPEYEQQGDWPLVMFLHGMGERGSDLSAVTIHGMAKLIAAGQDFPFVVVSPQCPLGSYWTEQLEALEALLDHVTDTLKIDQRRVYLTGLSMGGYGTWYLASRCPQRFAAIAPICGGGLPWAAERLAQVPVWAFHGSKDDIVHPQESRRMVQAVKEAGGSARLTMYKDVGHNSWAQAYDNPKLYQWMLRHSREET